MPPRAEYGLIHGELGPDHVMVDADGRAVLIDIEGLMHFDVEWEHVFLRLRFGERYPVLSRPGLDPRRTDLYALAMHLSLVAGPLRLLDGDFPDRAAMGGDRRAQSVRGPGPPALSAAPAGPLTRPACGHAHHRCGPSPWHRASTCPTLCR